MWYKTKAKNGITLTIGGPCFKAPDEKGNIVLGVLSADQPRFEREAGSGEKNDEVVCMELDQGRASLFVHCLDTGIDAMRDLICKEPRNECRKIVRK